MIENIELKLINKKAASKTVRSGVLRPGQSVAITGILPDISRAELHRKIKSIGGIVKETLTNKTDYLILGDRPGSALACAKVWDVFIVPAVDVSYFLQDCD